MSSFTIFCKILQENQTSLYVASTFIEYSDTFDLSIILNFPNNKSGSPCRCMHVSPSQFVHVLVAILRLASSCSISCPPLLLVPPLSHDINLSLWFLLFDVTRKTNQTFYSWSMSNAEISLEFKCSLLIALTPGLHSLCCTKPSPCRWAGDKQNKKRSPLCSHLLTSRSNN